jgi:hypothetical protein
MNKYITIKYSLDGTDEIVVHLTNFYFLDWKVTICDAYGELINIF